MTLIELLVFIPNVAFVLGVARFGYNRDGVPGAFVGFIVGVAIVVAFWFVLGRIAAAAHRNRKLRDDDGG